MGLKVEAAQRSAGLPGGMPNEDRTAFKAARGAFYAWVIDGGTTPDPSLRTANGTLPGAWFAEQMSDALWSVAEGAGDLRGMLRGAVDRVGAAWRAQALDWPDWALPVGAVSLLRLRPEAGGLSAEGLHLADCPVAVLRGETVLPVHAWNPEGDADEARRLGGDDAAQAAMIDALKARRARQQAERPFRLLTLDPACAEDAVATTARMAPGDRLLVASDGIARAWTEYGLLDAEEGARRLRDASAFEALLEEVRAFERDDYAQRAARMMKVGDDASVVIVTLA